ncbi:MAG: lectin [Vicinamibacteria bacterium]
MYRTTTSLVALAAIAVMAGATSMSGQQAQAPQQPMSFFVTSVGPGNGGNLGGLAGADKHCQTLAAAAGAGGKTWRAYLSQTAAGATPTVNARDRIGAGPWYNARGVLIASNLADLHEDRNNVRKATALDEKGAEVKGVGDTPNQHDILTGSDSQGRALPGAAQVTTCNNWTSADPTHRAMVGHHDRLGGPNASWNAVHSSAGCAQENLVKTGGAGLLYCFAIN